MTQNIRKIKKKKKLTKLFSTTTNQNAAKIIPTKMFSDLFMVKSPSLVTYTQNIVLQNIKGLDCAITLEIQ